jgi:hypothetical protein
MAQVFDDLIVIVRIASVWQLNRYDLSCGANSRGYLNRSEFVSTLDPDTGRPQSAVCAADMGLFHIINRLARREKDSGRRFSVFTRLLTRLGSFPPETLAFLTPGQDPTEPEIRRDIISCNERRRTAPVAADGAC